MRLLNHTLIYLSVAFLVVIGVWSLIFYLNFLDEIYDSIDDGLENSKMLIIERIKTDSSLINKNEFMESNYAIREIPAVTAKAQKDRYIDSTLYMVNEKDYEPVRILKSAFRGENGKFYELKVVSSMVEEDDLIGSLLYSLIWLYVILLLSILIINNVVLKKVWTPFYRVIELLKGFSIEKDETLSLPSTRVTEFKVFNEAVSSLVQRTSDTFKSQKQFIENAAHELQTPLAIAINKLELLAETLSSETQTQQLSSAVQTLERLKRLNKSLLLLSRIENRQFPETSDVHINEVVSRLASELTDVANYKSVSIAISDNHQLRLKMNKELASIMIFNLLKNAIIHNAPGGFVRVKIDHSGLSVENSGATAAPHADKIFRRFYKQSGSETSTGLGLAIVKSVADYYGFKVEYKYEDHHIFKIVTS